MVNNLIGFGSGGDAPVVELFRNATRLNDTSGTTTVSFTNADIGAASATRRVIVLVHGRFGSDPRVINSASIGGVSATIDAQIGAYSGGTSMAGIISATVPTGTTATVSITFSGNTFDCAIHVLALDGLQSVTPVDTATASATSGTSLTTGANVDWKYGGYVIAIATGGIGSGSATWNGVAEYADSVFNGSHCVTAAYLQPSGDANAQTISVTWSIFANRQALAVASYR